MVCLRYVFLASVYEGLFAPAFILEMPGLGFLEARPPGIAHVSWPAFGGDGDDVVAPVAYGEIWAFGHPEFGSASDALLGGGGDGFQSEGVGFTGFDLDKGDKVFALGDEVNFASRCAHTAGEDGVTF